MRWRGRRQSRNIEDRRGRGGGYPGGVTRTRGRGVRRAGGGGIGFLILLGVLWLVFDINPAALLQQGGGVGTPTVEYSRPAGDHLRGGGDPG